MPNFLIAYDHLDWHRAGYIPKNWFSRLKCDLSDYPLEKTSYWTDVKHYLPFYIPKGFPVSCSSVERQYKKKFDFILELDGSIPYHLSGMKKVSAKKALWSVDPYRQDKQKFHGWISGDFDVIFVLQKNFLHLFDRNKAFWVTCACDHNVYKNYGLPKIYDVAFIGQIDPKVYPERARLLNLLKSKFNVTIFSNYYRTEPSKFGAEAAKIYSQSKIVFNKTGFGEINLRLFEALGCRSLLIMDRLKKETGLDDLFQDGKHLVLYDNDKDLLDKVSYYLQNEAEREKIALEGQNEVLKKHTFEHRAQTIFEILKKFKI